MKLCECCCRLFAEKIVACPLCGADLGPDREYIDNYRIEKIVHEGNASTLCRASEKNTGELFMLRIFTGRSGIDEAVARRLARELEALNELPADRFVRHYGIYRSADGLWYRVSQWVEAENWSDLIISGGLDDQRGMLDIFHQMASSISLLHRTGHIMPLLNLGDVKAVKNENKTLKILIDYKYSRFLVPKTAAPGPGLKNVLECHPDIARSRPLDFRSDIWSLGKVFVELLTADFNACDFPNKIDGLKIPRNVRLLLKSMLAEDPDLRPESMADVAEILSKIAKKTVEAIHAGVAPAVSPETAPTGGRFSARLKILSVVILALGVFAGRYWYHLDGTTARTSAKKPDEAPLSGFADRYADSVAFVAVDYWLKEKERVVYRSQAEGTAFLVDDDGYLLTNRHVACPWLVDAEFDKVIEKNRVWQMLDNIGFGYRMYLWFEGQKAFNRSPDILESSDPTDIYRNESAFCSDAFPRVSIAGVAMPPSGDQHGNSSTLMNDFAILKIDRVPSGLKPLPLGIERNINSLPRLAPIFSMGFPLGTETLGDTVRASVTWGHVRRTLDGMIQVDASFYRGNSGGPVVGPHGRVIGIATRVAVAPQHGQPLFLNNRLSDFGLVLPVTGAVSLIREIKSGNTKWNGRPDPAVGEKLKRIKKAACENRWTAALTLAEKELASSRDPALFMAAGMMHLCAGEIQEAGKHFEQARSINPGDDDSGLMLFLADWLESRPELKSRHAALLDASWRSRNEFNSYLARILASRVDLTSALAGWYTDDERSWISYVAGLLLARNGDLPEAETMFAESVAWAGGDGWTFFLARAGLERVQLQRLESCRNPDARTRYLAESDGLLKTALRQQEAQQRPETRQHLLWEQFYKAAATPEDKLRNLTEILQVKPNDVDARLTLAVHLAAQERWPQALDHTRIFLSKNGRENANRLGAGLLEPLILLKMGLEDQAFEHLKRFRKTIQDPWYRSISDCLMGGRSEISLLEEARENPQNLITAHTALGLWAEGSGDVPGAISHYKEAMATCLNNWLEYDLAMLRIQKLKKLQNKNVGG